MSNNVVSAGFVISDPLDCVPSVGTALWVEGIGDELEATPDNAVLIYIEDEAWVFGDMICKLTEASATNQWC